MQPPRRNVTYDEELVGSCQGTSDRARSCLGLIEWDCGREGTDTKACHLHGRESQRTGSKHELMGKMTGGARIGRLRSGTRPGRQ
jgi:hypothetical protein